MTASVQSPADAVNIALRKIGYKLRVGSLFEGSLAAKNALDLYFEKLDGTKVYGEFVEHLEKMVLE